MAQPPVQDGPIPFFGAAPATGPPSSNRQPPPPQRPPQHHQQQQQHQHHQQQQQQQHQHQHQQQRPPMQPQPQRHPQQHPHQMPPHPQPGSQQTLQRPQPPRQMNQSPFAPAADLFASPPTSNLIFNQAQAPPQGYQPQPGPPPPAKAQAQAQPVVQAPPQAQAPVQQQQQQQPPRFPPQQSPVLQKSLQQQPAVVAQQQQQQQHGAPPQRPPVQQQQQHHQQAPPNQFQRNPQQQQFPSAQEQQQQPEQQQEQQQQGFPQVQESAPVPAATAVPLAEQSNSPFAPAADLFGNSTLHEATGWAIPSTASQPLANAPAAPPVNAFAPPHHHQQQQQHQQHQQQQQQQPPSAQPFPAAPAPGVGRPPLPPAPLQKQPSLTQVPQAQQAQQAPLAPPPQRQPSLPSPQQQHQHQQQPPVQQQQYHQAPSRQGSISTQGPPLGPPRHSPIAPGPHGPPPAQHGFDRSAGQLPPIPRTSMATPRQGPLSGPLSASSTYQGTSPYANHVPPKTPLLTAIQTPLMLPAQTLQSYQSSRTPYMGPVRNQFGSSSQLLLEPCPYAECGGENKPHAKFCSECGRSISTASRSATPSLGHYAEFPGSAAPPMPSLDRMNSYHEQQPQHQQQLDQQPQPAETYTGYTQDTENYQQQQQQPDYTQDQQQYGYSEDQQQQQQQTHQPYDQGYDQTYDQNYGQEYSDAAYYDQNQQVYDPATGQYVDTYAQQDQVVPEPEPEPEEEYIDDPLNRINGCPLIAFGFGGKIMTSFPRTVQRFDSATSNMITKKYPGDLQLEHIKDILQGDKAVSTYPGPLLMDSSVQMKNKRKDVLKMIEDKIKEFEHEPESGLDAHHVLIWRLFKVMFEQDGALVGGAKVDEAVRSVLLSIPLSVYPAQPSQEPISPLRTSASMDVLQDLLRNGDRAGAVRYAMSSNLWAHALVISSCVNKELWKEAVNGFVNQELTSGGGDVQANGREALRVLYALFSGQTQTAITELIPLNLRTPAEVAQDDAPIGDDQFVTGASLSLMKPAEEHTEGSKVPSTSLGQWRDTLVMILSNRTSGDQTAISSLGDLLLKEGWVEAAHICYLLSPQSSVHSGPDAQLNRLVLIGADANPYGTFPFYKNVEAFQKTEIYEFACALRSAGATGGLPFLQAYKLIYVWTLVELGMFSEAGRYLASVEAIVKTQTKGSPYYNTVFLERLKDITERLTGSSQLTVADESWFAKKVPKPTIGGIFDALDNKISKFIAGDNDQPKPVVAEPTINAAETGPFANAPALPDLSNIPARTASRSSNGVRQGPPAAITSRRSSGLGRASLDVPKIDTYSHLQAAVPHTDAVQEAVPTFDGTAAQDPAYDNFAGYDQNAQYGVETYPQGDYSNTGYEQENQGYAYDSAQTYGETYQAVDDSAYPQDQTQDQLQPDIAGQEYQQQTYGGEENLQTQSGYEGQYDAQYNTHYDASQYEQPAHEATAGETVAALAIQPDVVPASADSAQFSTMAVLGSEKPSVDGHTDVAAADASAESAAPAGEYDANYGQYAEGAEGTFDNTAYTGEYQQDGYQQGEYQQDAYQQGEYQQDAYQQGEYQQDGYQQGEYQQGDYQQGEYQQGDYQQGDYQQGEYQQGEHQQGEHQQGEYQQDAYQQGEDQAEQYQQDNAVYAEQQYSEQQQYDQSVYQDQSQVPAVEGADQGLGAEYSDAAYQSQGIEEPQQVLEDFTAQANPVSEIAPQAAEQVQEVLADEPTFEQQSAAEDTAPVEPAVEATAHAANIEQDGYQQDGYQQGEYQPEDYQQGDYQQGDYQQGDYQQGDYSQADYQQGEYAQDGYQQGDYQQGEYQQADYQQGEYAQDGYQQADYQQGEYQQGEYAQDGYQQADYQQGDYQQTEYAQEGFQQEQHTGAEAEPTSTEPGVLPVSSEYQDQAEFNASGVYQGHPNGAEYSTEGEQPQQDYASNNNAWWGNGEGAYSDPNATEQQPLPVEGQAPVEDGSQANYEEGQFISFGAVPTIPSFGQPAVPVNNTSSQHQHAFDDADDLGMGNNALKKEKQPAVAAEDANAANATGEAGQDANAAMGEGSDESKAGWWPKIALFGGEKRELTPKPVKANLGEESSFYFDKEQKRWVNKKGGSESSSTSEALPPPPKTRTTAAAPAAAGSGPSPVAGGPAAMNSGPPSSGGPVPPSSGGPVPPAGGPPGPRPGAGSATRRGARAKYVDVLNPQ